MVRGITIFSEYFKDYTDNYIIIGGTACDIIIEGAGLVPRATKDIDIILIVEALSSEFVTQFWQLIQDGNYERKEKGSDGRKYYRFTKPGKSDFPYQIELFSRKPDLIDLEEPVYLTPIPVDDDLSSLSAILLSDDYYKYMINQSNLQNGIHLANTEALICLKAKAFLEISDRIANGSKEDVKHLRKHKTDVFRLAVTLTENDIFELPEIIKQQLQKFVNAIADDLPDKAIYKEMGFASIDVEKVFIQLSKNFNLRAND